MKLAALCCTYLRPGPLAEAVESFLRQDYPAEMREIVVLDDAAQYDPAALDGLPGVRLVTTRHRFRTLGEKRNASAALAGPDVDAYCVWDDDDIYLPWHMTAAATALADADYAIPTVVYVDRPSRLERKTNRRLFHPAWAFRRAAFERVDGYPFMQSGQDQMLLRRFESAQLRCGDPLAHDPRPSFLYRWHTAHNEHLSAMGPGGYERLAGQATETVRLIVPGWSRDWLELHQRATRPDQDTPQR